MKMSIKQKISLKGKSLLGRLTGISSPIGGVSWKPPLDEQEKARRLFVFLADRRALYAPYNVEVEYFVKQSILETRKRLVADLEELQSASVLRESLLAMTAACRKYLEETQKQGTGHYQFEPEFFRSLGEVRALFGVQIARIAYAYDLEVEGDLVSILPPEGEATTPAKNRRSDQRKKDS
jgi:hypothetical protein